MEESEFEEEFIPLDFDSLSDNDWVEIQRTSQNLGNEGNHRWMNLLSNFLEDMMFS